MIQRSFSITYDIKVILVSSPNLISLHMKLIWTLPLREFKGKLILRTFSPLCFERVLKFCWDLSMLKFEVLLNLPWISRLRFIPKIVYDWNMFQKEVWKTCACRSLFLSGKSYVTFTVLQWVRACWIRSYMIFSEFFAFINIKSLS